MIQLRLYPDVPAILRATAGTVQPAALSNRIDTIRYEILSFQGTDRAQLKFPGSSDHDFKSLAAFFNSTGGILDEDINFSYDPNTDEIIASLPFYGGVQVSYSASYQVLDYIPAFEETGGVTDIGYVTRYGMVLAAYQKAIATYSVQMPDIAKNSDYIEFYRVYSKVIADPDGRWEVPPGWPNSTRYPYLNQEGPDPENSHDEERPHEVGFIDTTGHIDYQTYYAPIERPYFGMANYRPKLFLRRRQLPPKDYEQAFQSVDWPTLNQRLALRYPGMSSE